ncbi:MAG TPA: SusC/RagA family TonB-linked outer membrane protein [Balneolaceae bacterium]
MTTLKARLLSLAVLLCLAATIEAPAQTGTIKGKITEANTNEELPGANVVLKELQMGASTDEEGNYIITNVPSGTYTLEISFIGYKKAEQSIEVGSGEMIVDVALQPDYLGMEEIYVTAYGVQKTKNELAYSAQKVSGEEISQTRSQNFLLPLSGRVAGVNISHQNGMGGSTNIVMRGYKSITGNNQVLFVVDGVPYANHETNTRNQETGRGGYDYGNTATDINPDNIASINVLKGPAAAALYGSRAANGAVVITTKSGSGQRGIGVTLNSSVGVGMVDRSTLPNYQRLYGAGYGPLGYGSPDGFFWYLDVNGDGSNDLVAPLTEDASYGAPFDPNRMVYQWDAFIPNHPNFGQPRPWMAAENGPAEFFESSTTFTNSLMIQGEMDRGFFTLGYNQSNQSGILPNSSLDEHKLNVSTTYDITDRLQAMASINFVQTEGLGRYGTGYDAKNMMTSFRQWWQMNVDIEEMKEAYFRDQTNATWNLNSDLAGPIYWDNPYWDRYENYQNDARTRNFGFVSLQYDLLDWLNIMGRVSVDTYDEIQEERIAQTSIDVPAYSRFNQSFSEYNYDLLLNYSKQLTDAFEVSGVLGTNIRRNRIQSIDASTNGGLLVPRFYSLSNTLNPLLAPVEVDQKLGVDGYFASLSVDYRNMLILDLTGRRDQSSSLPEGENVYYYPSASLGFVFTELLNDRFDWLNYGKLRFSIAQVGNTAPVYSIFDSYDKPAPFGSIPLFSIPVNKNNPELKPELTESWEAGLEMTFVQDRIGFDVTYYKQNTIDQIIPIEISRATGFVSKFINAGNVENRGVEVTLNARPVVSGPLIWTLTANWARNINEVKELAPGIQNLQLASFQGGVSINAALGEPYGTIRGSDFVYLNGQRVVGPDGFYLRTTTQNEIIGNMNPDWFGGLYNLIQYRNIALNFLIDVRYGGDIFSLDQYYGQGTGLYANTAAINENGKNVRDPVSEGGGIVLEGVQADGTPNTVRADGSSVLGAFGYVNNPNAAFVYDGSYVKLREVGISYSLPQNLINQIGVVRNIDLSLIGRNLWIIHKNLPDSDPEQSLSSGNLQGYQGGAYPSVRHFVFNIELQF